MNWQQTTLVEPPSAGGTNLDPRLRFEFGWAEVRSGLGLVLRGWLQIPLVLLFAVGVMVSIFSTKEDGGHQLSAESRLLAMELLMALVGLAILYSWACILSGYWRCLMHAPERHWTKWLMYGCILCVCGGPVIGTVLGTGSIPKQVKLQHGMEGFKQIELSMEALVLQGVAMAVNLLNFVLFILFLRAIARCFNDSTQILRTDFYLWFYGVTVGVTLFFIFVKLPLALRGWLMLCLLGSWLLCFIGFLVLVGLARGSITRGMWESRSLRR